MFTVSVHILRTIPCSICFEVPQVETVVDKEKNISRKKLQVKKVKKDLKELVTIC